MKLCRSTARHGGLRSFMKVLAIRIHELLLNIADILFLLVSSFCVYEALTITKSFISFFSSSQYSGD
jgi:hypothetical protein